MSSRYSVWHLRLALPFFLALVGKPRSLSHDLGLLLQGARPTPRALGIENIPPASPFIVVINHYDRPGLGAWWGAAIVVTSVAARRTHEPREVHFMMAREWWYPSGFGRWIKQPITRWAFGQLAKTYGLVALPPVVEHYRGTAAYAIRRALTLTRGDNPQLVGLAPEGTTGQGLALCEPPIGNGLFLTMLAHDKIPFLPVGLYEEDTLIAKFGKPFELHVPHALPREQRDREIARQVMTHIGALLPEKMWGVYHNDVRNFLSANEHE